MRRPIINAACLLGWCALSTAVSAQSSSLLGAPGQRQPLTLERNSWLFQKVEPPKELQLHDVITVVVKMASQVTSEGQVDRRKDMLLDIRLRDWVELDGFGIKAAPQEAGDPRMRGSVNSLYRAQSDLETKDAMQFSIAATVVDVRPNGNLVIEAHQSIQNNNEVWEKSLTGIVRRDSILPGNRVLSESVAELTIYKREKGHVRDGYRRGWFTKAWDRFSPF